MYHSLKITCVSFVVFWALGAQAASNIVMVLPGKELPTEVAFKDYLQKKQVDAKYTVVPFSTVPRCWIAPAVASSASTSVVLPLPLCPSSAMLRM